MKIIFKKFFYLLLALLILIAPFFFFSKHSAFALYIWVISIVYFLFFKNKIKKDFVSRETLNNDE